jgi:hypothetical protein
MATPTFFLPHEALANEPTLLDRIQKQTLQRAQISRTTREEDVAQRTQAAYRMLEGIEEEAPTGGYGALFGQRASGAGFRTKEDAAAFLRATDPEGMTTRQKAVGEFMANQALPRLGTITDPAQRLAALKEMAASGPPMLNGIVSKIAADGVITDEEMAQAEGMFGGYRTPDTYVNLGAQGVFNATRGSIVENTARTQAEVPPSVAGLDWAYRNPDNPAAKAIIEKHEADLARIGRANRPTAGGGGGSPAAARTTVRNIGGVDTLIDLNTGDVIRQIGPSGRPDSSASQGSVERRFNEQFIGAAQSAFKDVSNVMKMRVSSNAGFMGIGSRPGRDIMRSSIDTLRNALASEDVQRYVQQADNSARMIAYVETGGRQINESMVNEIKDALVIRENDTGYTALQRLATYRQIIEQFVGPKLASEALPEAQKKLLRQSLADLAREIPFTVDDVISLERGDVRVAPKRGESFIEYARRAFRRPAPAARIDTNNPFFQPFGTPAAPLNLGPAQRAPTAPAPAPSGGPTNIGRGITIERID